MADNPHKDHRKRLKKELLEQDFPESVPVHKFLEMLLFYGIPRKDTNPIAHDLLDKFGTLSGMFDAAPQDLYEVKGMTENAVALIKLIMPLARKANSEKYTEGYKFNNIDEFGTHLVEKFLGYNNEVFIISGFDIKGRLICDEIITKGDVDNVAISIKEIVKTVLRRKMTGVIVSHNHIDSPALPSVADIEMTKSLKFTLEQINVKLLDHIIVSGNDYVSLRQSPTYSHLL